MIQVYVRLINGAVHLFEILEDSAPRMNDNTKFTVFSGTEGKIYIFKSDLIEYVEITVGGER